MDKKGIIRIASNKDMKNAKANGIPMRLSSKESISILGAIISKEKD